MEENKEEKQIGIRVCNSLEFVELLKHYEAKGWINYNSLESPQKGIFPCTFEYKDNYQLHLNVSGYRMIDFAELKSNGFTIPILPATSSPKKAIGESVSDLIKKEQSLISKHNYEEEQEYKNELLAIDYYIRLGATQSHNEMVKVIEDQIVKLEFLQQDYRLAYMVESYKYGVFTLKQLLKDLTPTTK